jgi:hypothetical protein
VLGGTVAGIAADIAAIGSASTSSVICGAFSGAVPDVEWLASRISFANVPRQECHR